MTKENVLNILQEEGWAIEELDKCYKCYCGAVSLTLAKDEEGEYISLPIHEKQYLQSLQNIDCTPFRILFKWDNYQEWYLKY